MSIRTKLKSNKASIEESMGVRTAEPVKPVLASNPKNISRRPALNFGTIPISQIQPDPNQPRTEFADSKIEELAASIKRKGQLQPIRVRWSEPLKSWTIIAGERRWRATKLAGLETIACHFHDGDLSESEILEEQIIENIQRQSLQPLEEAKAFASLIAMNNWKGKDVAASLGIHPAKVSRSLALLKLPNEIQAQVESGDLPARTAYEISKLASQKQQRNVAEVVLSNGLTNTETANRVRARKGRPNKKSKTTRLSFQTSQKVTVVVSKSSKATYEQIELALQEALAEVEHRIENNIQIL